MRTVVEGGELVFDVVAVPVLGSADTAGVVVSHHACPHDVGAGVVVVGVLDDSGTFVDHCEQKGLDEPVGHFDFFCVCQVALVQVGHDIRDAGSGLPRGQRLGQRRIQDGEFRADRIAGGAALEQSVFFCDDAVRTAFAARCGDREDGADGECIFDIFTAVEIPEVAVVDCTGRNRFGGVDCAAAADSQNEVDVFSAAEVDSFVDQAAAGIGLDAAEREVGDVFFSREALTRSSRPERTTLPPP